MDQASLPEIDAHDPAKVIAESWDGSIDQDEPPHEPDPGRASSSGLTVPA